MKKSANALALLNTKTLIAPLVCIVSLLALNDTQAATLGRMKVLSPLGAAFNAEIELVDVSPEEEANLTVKVAAPDLFKRAGLEYSPILSNIKAVVNKDARPFKVVLTSQSAVSEPLLEVLMDLNWQSGRLLRQYTVLLDPTSSVDDVPETLSALPATAPQVSSNSITQAKPAPAIAPEVNSNRSTTSVGSTASKITTNTQAYTVKKGDTLYSIARGLTQGNTVYLNQLMNLLVKTNPNSFINRDKNRLKSGVVLNTTAAQNFVADAADKTVNQPLNNSAASKDFSRYKQAAANQSKVTKNDSTASKVVRNSVKPEAIKPIETLQDQLKVSGKSAAGAATVSASAKQTEESRIAEERAKGEEREKLALLKKTLKTSIEITNNTLANATTPNVTAQPNKTVTPPVKNNEVAKPTVNSNAQLPVVATTAVVTPPVVTQTQPVAPLNTPSAESNNTMDSISSPDDVENSNNPLSDTTTSDSLTSAPDVLVKTDDIANNEATSSSWFSRIDALTVGGIAGLLALLAAAWFYLKRKKQQDLQDFSDTQFNINDTQGTLLTADGGQAVDTFNSVFASTFSEMNPAESSEVDPVAEADVYMQYGRDAHAEEILKDALKKSPNRVPVHLKLMEIHANKNDHAALKERFGIISELTQSSGQDWDQAKTILNQSLVHPDSLSAPQVSLEATTSNINNVSLNADADSNALNYSTVDSSDSNSTILKNRLPDISLSSPTQIGDVPTTMNITTDTTSLKNNEKNKVNGNIQGNSNVKDALNMNVLKLDTPVSLINPTLNIVNPNVSKQTQPSTASSAVDSLLDFNVQTPTLFSPQTSIAGLSKNTVFEDNLFLKKPTTEFAVPDTVVKNVTANDSNPNSLMDFKLSKLSGPLETNSILDKVSDDVQLGLNSMSGGVQALETKFSLAQAYLEIGDKDGAKELLNEVLKSGHQHLSDQAKAMLAKI